MHGHRSAQGTIFGRSQKSPILVDWGNYKKH